VKLADLHASDPREWPRQQPQPHQDHPRLVEVIVVH
jgi:hypothetical protein